MSDVKKRLELSDEQMEQISGGKAVVFTEYTASGVTGDFAACHVYKCTEVGVSAAMFAASMNGTLTCPGKTGGCQNCSSYSYLGSVRKDQTSAMANGWKASGFDVLFN
jgi:hypothetical protein